MIPLTFWTTQTAKIVVSAVAITYALVFILSGWMHGGHYDEPEQAKVCKARSRRDYLIGVGLALVAAIAIELLIVPKVIAGTLCVLLGAGILFVFKIRTLRLYAALELIFAVSITIKTIAGLKDAVVPTELLTLLVSAYLVIRGLDNMHKALESRKNQKLSSGSTKNVDHAPSVDLQSPDSAGSAPSW